MHRLTPSLILLSVILAATAARADIFQWEYIDPADPSQGKQQSTTLCPGSAGVDAVPGARLGGLYLRMAYLNSADLSGAYLSFSYNSLFYLVPMVLTDADLSQANLRDANFDGADLTNADLTGADIRGASFNTNYEPIFGEELYGGLTLAQLYSTASYHVRDLSGVELDGNNLGGANFAHQNLTNSSFGPKCFDQCVYINLSGVDFTGADVRGADYLDYPGSRFNAAIKDNLIGQNGHVNGLDLDAGGLLDVRDYDGYPGSYRYNLVETRYRAPVPPIPITIDQHLTVGPGGTLRMVFEADGWDSTISFAPGIPVTLGGTLELTFADNVNPASQVGRTFDLFDWTGVTPTGAFAVSSPYAWDLSNLYTTGQVTLTAIPEPATIAFTALGLLGLVVRVRRRLPSIDSRSKSDEEFHAETQRRGGVDISYSSLRPQRLCVSLLSLVVFTGAARADIFQWEYIDPADPSQGKRQSTTLCPSGAGVDAVPGGHYWGLNLTMAYLNSADLSGANLSFHYYPFFPDPTVLTDADLSQANLSDANFDGADLTNANLTGADIRGASFNAIFERVYYDFLIGDFTLAQLYSTASYAAHDLRGIGLAGHDLSGANFAGQNLTNSSFGIPWFSPMYGSGFLYATLIGADFTGADARGAANIDLSSATTTNLIWPDGHIDGLDLGTGGLLVVRDYDWSYVAVTVDQHLGMAPGGTLRMVFEADAWDSTISLAPGIPVTLGGTLELTFADNVDLASQLGRTFDLFNWTGVTPTSAFAVSSPYAWDLSNLYTTGQATLIGVPEPSSLVLTAAVLLGLGIFCQRTKS